MSHFVPNWPLLEKLRNLFLKEEFIPHKSYWENEDHLLQYDHTFGERIGWKWDSVLSVIKQELLVAPLKTIVDFGCGSGKASERFLRHFSPLSISDCYLWDDSKTAQNYAKNKLSPLYPTVNFHTDSPNALNENFILLVSHVLNELSPQSEKNLLALAAKAQWIIWVEPGTPKVSNKLVEIRETLIKRFEVLAPCPHQEGCGLLKKDQERQWCHFFASPPPEVFQSAFWREFSTHLGIDLRSLPVSYLVLRRKSPGKQEPNHQAKKELVLGGSRHFKGYSLVPTCSDEGIKEQKLMKRSHKQIIDLIKKSPFRFFLP